MIINRLAICIALLASLVTLSDCKADLTIFGESIVFSSPGIFEFDILAESVGQDVAVGGFNLEIDFSSPNLSVESVAYNPAFNSPFPVFANSDPAQLSASDTTFTFVGLPIMDGTSEVLATVSVNVAGPGFAQFSSPEVLDVFAGNVPTTVSGTLGGFEVTPIPEPTSLGVLAVVGTAISLRRRRGNLGS